MNKVLFSIAIVFVACACKKENVVVPCEVNPTGNELLGPVLPENLIDYESIIYPSYFLADPSLNFFNTLEDNNQISNAGVTLGRVLFYDKHLSVNNTISCQSCHHQANSFSDNSAFSIGFNNEESARNSRPILNVDFNRNFFWDLRAPTIEQQVLEPIEHPLEMGMDVNELPDKLKELNYYPNLFLSAFGSDTITVERIALALAQFSKSIRSFNSKYDQGLNQNFENFSTDELAGKEMFFSGEHRCINCHGTPNFGGQFQHIIGLDEVYTDQGIGAITGNTEDLGKFKAVSLRNIELTAPYMHDGRFESLEDVLDFYSSNVQAHSYLDDRLTSDFIQGGTPVQFNFTESQKKQYIAFLKTLTDWELINNPIYSDPFIH